MVPPGQVDDAGLILFQLIEPVIWKGKKKIRKLFSLRMNFRVPPHLVRKEGLGGVLGGK